MQEDKNKIEIQKYKYKNTSTKKYEMQIYNPMFGWHPFLSFQVWILRCHKYHCKLADRCMYDKYDHFNDDGDDVQLTCCHFNETPCMLQV